MSSQGSLRLPASSLFLSWLLFGGLLLSTLLHSGSAGAQTLRPEDLPANLREWIPWVLSEQGESVCHGETPEGEISPCEWPASLQLNLQADGGSFSLSVFLEREGTTQLPGSLRYWPVQVEAGGKPVLVLEKNGLPHAQLARGAHVLTGRFSWPQLPENLPVGKYTALLSLTVSGQPFPWIHRDGQQIRLKDPELDSTLSADAEHVDIQVYRKLQDGVPLLVETRLVFQVAGKARELEFKNPLLPETLPLSVEGDLAFSLEPSGSLRVQLLPGQHEIVLTARSVGVPTQLTSLSRPVPWPEREIWVWQPSQELRIVELQGAPGLDASRANLPAAWKQLSAFHVEPGAPIQLLTTRRGQASLPPNRLQLSREFWLDEAGKFFTVKDSLRGTMEQNWRLDLLSGELGQVLLAGEPQVITTSPSTHAAGVEVRQQELNIQALSRVPRTRSLAAVGWSENVESLSAELYLPPGWDVWFATGVDKLPHTWIARWDLFSVFFLLLVTLATGKLFGPKLGALALGALLLSHGESGAPQFLWLFLILTGVLSSAVTTGFFARFLRLSFHGIALILATVLILFFVGQVRHALFPHLENTHEFSSFTAKSTFAPADTDAWTEPAPALQEAAPEAAAPETEAAAPPSPPRVKQGRPGSLGSSFEDETEELQNLKKKLMRSGYEKQKQFKPDALVQTGPGVPDNAAKVLSLQWSGPVVADHNVQLYLISPTWMRLLTLLRLSAVAAFAFFLWKKLPHPPARSEKKGSSSLPRTLLATLCFAGLFSLTPSLHAEEPSAARLEELRAKLTAPPACSPHCITVSQMDILLDQQLEIRAQVHAGATGTYRLPGPAHAFTPLSLTVNGKRAQAVRLESHGSYVLLLEPGIHEIVFQVRLPSDRATLDIGDKPHLVQVKSTGWAISGINETGQIEGGTLTFARLSEPDPTNNSAQAGEQRASTWSVPPWYRVTRRVSLGLQAQVHTVIERLSDISHPEVLVLPLVPGEQATSLGLDVRDHTAILAFPREVRTREFTSTLLLSKQQDGSFQFSLQAPDQASYSEIWEVECGVVWHCTQEGLVSTSHITEGRALKTYYPWPGESLRLSGKEPAPTPGSTLTIDRAFLELRPGTRLSQNGLDLELRTSRTQVHSVQIPETAQLESLTIDGQAQVAKNENGRVSFLLTPGSHRVRIDWQSEDGWKPLYRPSAVHTGELTVNQRISVQLPHDRWILATGGPAQGPALLFWGYLALLVLAAWLLPRLPYSPLTTKQWLLLGLGLTQIPVLLALLVVGWFFFVQARSHWKEQPSRRRNFLQLLLLFFTFCFFITLTGAVYKGLLSSPDMEIQGAGSSAHQLFWYADRTEGAVPSIWILSVSIWVWRLLMLAWALWLAHSLLYWSKWAWLSAQEGGFWAPREPREPVSPSSHSPETKSSPSPSSPHTQGSVQVSDEPTAQGYDPVPSTEPSDPTTKT